MPHLIRAFGFLMNERWMLDEGLESGLVKYDPETYSFGKEGMNSIGAMKRRITREAGIPGLRMDWVWVGDGIFMLCWVLPRKKWKAPRSAEDNERLKKFRELAHITFGEKPMMWASADGDMPPSLRGVTQVRGEISAMQMESSRYWQPFPKSMSDFS